MMSQLDKMKTLLIGKMNQHWNEFLCDIERPLGESEKILCPRQLKLLLESTLSDMNLEHY